ncbi:MAG: RluA family pseudouridine synthase [Treponema sp.]|jgi:23S rRNA pseudouridine1911/1915/1917 synthase|nr:RluA family pseudouridine synthase [Treponema sp.]
MKQKPPFTIIYEDERIVVFNKASGIAVGADRWDEKGERLDKLAASFLGTRLFTVHRIDRGTSGLVVFAKDAETHAFLSQAFENRLVKKRYTAAVNGRPAWKETDCDLPLVPDGNRQHLTIIDRYRGKKSFTHFRLAVSAGNYSIVEALPETGRTHQIRVHLAALGHPVVCDPLYGNRKPLFLSSFKRNWRGDPFDEKPLLARLGLHAAELILPERGGLAGPLKLTAPLPRDMAALVNQMEKEGNSAASLPRESTDLFECE